jgi:hypothetical protein
MGIYGMGKAFNLRYAQNVGTPIKTRATKTQYTPPMFQTEETTTIVYKSGGGFWNNCANLLAGLSMGYNAIAGGSCGGGAVASGASGGSSQADTHLTNLTTLFPKFNIVSDGNGKYRATDANGKQYGPADYNEMCNLLSSSNTNEEGQGAQSLQQQPQATGSGNGNSNSSSSVDNNGAGNSSSSSSVNSNGTGNLTPTSTNSSTRTSSNTGNTSTGWYNQSADKNSFINNKRALAGKNAKDVTTLILNTKLDGALTPAQQEELRKAIIKKNPSVFNTQGEPLANADYSKLDIPTMDWIKTNILKEKTSNTGANSATGKAKQNNKYDENRLAQDGYVKQADGNYLRNGVLYTLNKDGSLKRVHDTQEQNIFLSGAGRSQKSTNSHTLDGNTLVQSGYRETNQKDIYFKNGRHYRLENGNLTTLSSNIKQVNSDGTWYDQKGQLQKSPLPTA